MAIHRLPIHHYTPYDHDQAVAEVSHLPHILANACADALSERGLPLAASGFRDTSRKAGGPSALWADILLSNRSAVCDQMQASIAHLEELLTALKANDRAAAEAWLERGRERRQLFDEAQTKQSDE